MKSIVLFLISMLTASSLLAQKTDLFIPKEIQQAYENETRSYSGKPGENYFQNRADYEIDAEFNPKTGIIEGSEQITYHNNSPDTLKYIALRLYMNLYKKGIDRDYKVPPEDLHDGIKIKHLAYNGNRMDSLTGDRAKKWSTIKMIRLPESIQPGGEATLSIDWEVELPEKKKYRFGEHKENNWFVAYWYPRISVYDDITGVYTGGQGVYRSGWDTTPWTGLEEFYNDFSDYNVTLSVPEDYVVWATGILKQPEKHFKPEILKRFKKAHESDSVIPIITSKDIENDNIIRSRYPWHFQAEQVPDFAFATSKKYLWNGTSVQTGSSDDRRVFVSSAYPEDPNQFNLAAKMSRQVIELYPEQVIPASFPFPKITAISAGENVEFGGMEYPMMINCKDYADTLGMKSVLAHEIIHNYFPFHLMTNESDYGFMDEGLTSFFTSQTMIETTSKIKPSDEQEYISRSYESMAGLRRTMPPMTKSYMVTDDPAYFLSAYSRPRAALYLLKNMLGEESFTLAMKTFMQRWKGKHPTPYDFFFTFEDVLNRDLSWFWEPWFFDFGYADLAIEEVNQTDNGHHITIEQQGKLPVPVDLTVWLDNDSTKKVNKSPAFWKNKDHYEVTFESEHQIDSIKLEHQEIPDVYPENNEYRAER